MLFEVFLLLLFFYYCFVFSKLNSTWYFQWCCQSIILYPDITKISAALFMNVNVGTLSSGVLFVCLFLIVFYLRGIYDSNIYILSHISENMQKLKYLMQIQDNCCIARYVIVLKDFVGIEAWIQKLILHSQPKESKYYYFVQKEAEVNLNKIPFHNVNGE